MLRPLYLSLLFSCAVVPSVVAQQPSLTVTLLERMPSAVGEHSSAHQVVFQVDNVSADHQTVRFACESAGRVVACSVSPPNLDLPTGQGTDVTVRVGTGGSGSGSVTLTATTAGGVSVEATAQVDVAAPPAVDVAPDGDIVTASAGSRGALEFTVTNVGTRRVNVQLTCDGQGVAQCEGLNMSAITLDIGASQVVRADYAVRGTGIGAVVVSARVPGSDTVPIDIGGISINACDGRCR